MFGFLKRSGAKASEVTADELAAMLARGEAIVVDVREPQEFVSGHIAGAVNLPLSAFDPSALPTAGGKRLVLNCAGGVRSATALDRCRKAEAAVEVHLRGGISAWRAAGLPLVAGG